MLSWAQVGKSLIKAENIQGHPQAPLTPVFSCREARIPWPRWKAIAWSLDGVSSRCFGSISLLPHCYQTKLSSNNPQSVTLLMFLPVSCPEPGERWQALYRSAATEGQHPKPKQKGLRRKTGTFLVLCVKCVHLEECRKLNPCQRNNLVNFLMNISATQSLFVDLN